jgi:hypothetical protein
MELISCGRGEARSPRRWRATEDLDIANHAEGRFGSPEDRDSDAAVNFECCLQSRRSLDTDEVARSPDTSARAQLPNLRLAEP